MLQQKTLILDPVKAAKEKLDINNTIIFSNLPQLHPCIVHGSYNFNLITNFRYENHNALLNGKLSGKIILICQRTLETFEYMIDNSLSLGFVTDDRFFKNFPENYEQYIYQNDQINLLELVEEEILLSIPMIPKKTINDCQAIQSKSYCSVFENHNTKSQETPNPFSALKKLKLT